MGIIYRIKYELNTEILHVELSRTNLSLFYHIIIITSYKKNFNEKTKCVKVIIPLCVHL